MLLYLVKLLAFRIYMFFLRWYRGGFFAAYGLLLKLLRRLDRSFGLRVNMRFFFQPLYQERNITGYLLGFFVRAFRIATGGILAAFSSALLLAGFIVWAAVPAIVMYKILGG